VHGIWQGMSGSPVYTAGGDLVGAVAYGMAWGNSWVAGVTPFEQMNKHLTQAAARVTVSDKVARSIAHRSDASRAQAEQGFRQLSIPLGVSSVRTDRLEQAFKTQKSHKARYLPRNAYKMAAAPAAAAAAVPEDTLVAGGNMAAAMSYGDITMGGVGTATAVCDEGTDRRIVGFGHPASFSGDSTMALLPADVVYVQGDPLGAPFKVANLGGPAGTVTDDHLTGITATFGDAPEVATVTSHIFYRGNEREGSSYVAQQDVAPDVTFYQQLANHDTVLDGIVKGSEVQDWTITGDQKGTPFTLTHDERYASSYDIAFESPWDVADIVWTLSSMDGVTIDDVTVNGHVDDNFATWRLKTVETKVGGRWTTLTRRDDVVARAGKDLVLRATLKDGGETVKRTVTVDIPKSARGKHGYLNVYGGGSDWSYYGGAGTVAGLQKKLDQDVRNDAVGAQLSLRGRGGSLQKQVESAPTSQVVTGYKFSSIRVR